MLWESVSTEESCEVCECTSLISNSFTLNSGGRSPASRRAEQRSRGAQRRLNIAPLRMSYDDVMCSPEKTPTEVNEELSFYCGNSPQASPRPCSISPCHDDIGLLSPENSPPRLIINPNNDLATVQLGTKRSFEIDYNSVDSGYGGAINNGSSTDSRPATFKFAEPLGVAPKRQDGPSPPKQPKQSSPKMLKSCFRPFNSLSSDSMDSMEDDYLELLDMDDLDDDTSVDDNSNLPAHFSSILSGDIKSTPEQRRPHLLRRSFSQSDSQVRTSLFESPRTRALTPVQEHLTPYSTRTGSDLIKAFKRPEPPTLSPIQSKRYKCETDNKENLTTSVSPIVNRTSLRKSISMNDACIMSALARSTSEPDLIGDFSKAFSLPLMDGRHRDLKSISSHTLARLLNGSYLNTVLSFKVIDCRYPYEYDGGHIRGAENLYTHDQILAELMSTKTDTAKVNPDYNKRHILVFHCEFSSERGPKLSRFLRNHDRLINSNSYPALHYPEIYLLHGGYKEFYETYSDLCVPIDYRPMLDPRYGDAYKHFRAKSKSWNGEVNKQPSAANGAPNRLVKSRSRLIL